MVDQRKPSNSGSSRLEPYVEPQRPTARGRDDGERRSDGGLARSPWRQWRSEPARIDTTPPLEVNAAKRPQYGRFMYMLIIFFLAFYGLNLIYTHAFWLNASGSVSGQQFVLSPSQTVRVESVMVEPTDTVTAGQVLVGFSSPQVEHEVAQTLMTIAELERKIEFGGQDPNATNTIDSLRSEIQVLESEQQFLAQQYAIQRDEYVDPMRELVAQGAIGSANLREAEAELREIMAKRNQAEARIRGLQSRLAHLQRSQSDEQMRSQIAALERLREGLESRSDDLVLKAPSDGIIARVPIEKGETLSAGDETIYLVQRESLRSYLYFPPAARGRLEPGQTLPVTLPSGHRVSTRVSKIYPSVQAVPQDAWPSETHANSAAVVVAVEPTDDDAMNTLLQLESGTPVNARVARWRIPDLNEAASKVTALFSSDNGDGKQGDAAQVTADAGS